MHTMTRPVLEDQPAPMLRDDERQRCEVWTRVMGYHRPVSSFNIGKQGEFHERVYFVGTPSPDGGCLEA
jgi:hypothetical protein